MAPAIAKAPGVKGRPEAVSAAPATLPAPTPPPDAPRFAAGPMPAQMIALLQRMRADVEKNCDYVGPGYGLPTPGMLEAVQMLAQMEGILLDPVYSGKGMAGLIDLIRRGHFRKGENVVFLHTGGSVGLFGYREVFAP